MSKRVLIGMSGGIDSTVAAILLLEQGYELVGATFRTFDPSTIANSPSPNCASEQSILDAQHMAATLGFEHHILDFRDTFREHVIANFVSEYAHGRTPNPCVMCNSHIKWGKLMQAAEQYGCDLIATGHYAQIADYRGHTYLKNAVDTHKDQTYFLWMLTEENLRHTIFPLGGLTKTEVRQIALNHGFEALSKKAESQEICFVPNNDYRTFLAEQGISVPQGEYKTSVVRGHVWSEQGGLGKGPVDMVCVCPPGHRRDRCGQGGLRHHPDGRQLHQHRQGCHVGPQCLRQHLQVPAVPADGQRGGRDCGLHGRLHHSGGCWGFPFHDHSSPTWCAWASGPSGGSQVFLCC